MSFGKELQDHRLAEINAAAAIKQELVEGLNGLGDDCPKIKMHDKDVKGIIIEIRRGFRHLFKAVILEEEGLMLREGYFRSDQLMRFSPSDLEGGRQLTPGEYVRYAEMAGSRLSSVAHEIEQNKWLNPTKAV